MSERGIRIIDLVVWACVGGALWAVLLMVLGCQTLDNLDTVVEIARDAQEQGKVIAEQVKEEDWLGVTESVLIGAGAVLSAFGAKKGYDKLKKQG